MTRQCPYCSWEGEPEAFDVEGRDLSVCGHCDGVWDASKQDRVGELLNESAERLDQAYCRGQRVLNLQIARDAVSAAAAHASDKQHLQVVALILEAEQHLVWAEADPELHEGSLREAVRWRDDRLGPMGLRLHEQILLQLIRSDENGTIDVAKKLAEGLERSTQPRPADALSNPRGLMVQLVLELAPESKLANRLRWLYALTDAGVHLDPGAVLAKVAAKHERGDVEGARNLAEAWEG